MLEQALVVEQALFQVAQAALSGGAVDTPRVRTLAICLSNRLAHAGPQKRIALPRDPWAMEATRKGIVCLMMMRGEPCHSALIPYVPFCCFP